MAEKKPSYRRATAKDLPSICELGQVVNRLHHAAWPRVFAARPDQAGVEAHWRGSLEGEAAATFLACGDQGNIGFVTVQLVDETHCLLEPLRFARVGTLCVAAPMRGQGIGRALMEQAQRWAGASGATEIRLEVWAFNEAAVRLYEELGYEVRAVAMSKAIRPDIV